MYKSGMIILIYFGLSLNRCLNNQLHRMVSFLRS